MSTPSRRCTNPRCSEYSSTSYSKDGAAPNSDETDTTRKWVGYGKCYDCSQLYVTALLRKVVTMSGRLTARNTSDEIETAHIERQSSSSALASTATKGLNVGSGVTHASVRQEHRSFFTDEKGMAAVFQPRLADGRDGRDRRDSFWMQAVLIARIYGLSALKMSIWLLSVLLALGASSVMYYYITARAVSTLGDTTKRHPHPSTLTFIVACIVCALATIPHIYSQRFNRYQSHYYLASLCGLTTASYFSGWNTAVDILPADLTITLVLSSAFHAIYPQRQPGRRVISEKRDQKLSSPLLPK
ncbi:hypothetical protein CONLIGDRAFT_673485 [Coniochaeta ligniaria NRRL 30616]|uniref:Uncharacterized protein n=1 Tax=Coniochaeta ligniaria NRRL 30616 TaxID=1408157 RepID=A0A1J7ID56_9PEZI|nr:hypothetical protein CONLIGDRAFT_673485 [Coniochaeta ligniaria NRRL 30616]